MATASASPRTAPATPRRPVSAAAAGIAAITLAALVLRLVTLSEQSYWVDESYTVHLVRLGFGTMLSTIPRTESTPPLYYVLAWFWTHVFGSGEFGLRSLSALAGTGVVAVGGLIALRISGARAALIATTLLAVNPLLVWFSQEARAYALATLLTAVSLLLLLRYADQRRVRDLTLWALTAALALCTHYFTAFVILPGALWLLAAQRRSPHVLRAVGAVGLVAVALAPLALAQRGTGHADYIAGLGGLGTRIVQIPKQLLVGYASPAELATAVLAAALLIIGVARPLGLRARPRGTAGGLVIGAGLVGVLLPVGLALIGIDFIDTRNVLPTLPAFAALAAAGLASPTSGRLGVWCAAGLAAVSLGVIVLVDTHPAYQRINWRGAAHALGPVTETRVILVNPASSLPPMRAYAPALQALTGTVAVRELDYEQIPGGTVPLLPATPITFAPPAGFQRVSGGVYDGYSIVRFRAATPVTVTQAELSAVPLGHDRVVLVQSPG